MSFLNICRINLDLAKHRWIANNEEKIRTSLIFTPMHTNYFVLNVSNFPLCLILTGSDLMNYILRSLFKTFLQRIPLKQLLNLPWGETFITLRWRTAINALFLWFYVFCCESTVFVSWMDTRYTWFFYYVKTLKKHLVIRPYKT